MRITAVVSSIVSIMAISVSFGASVANGGDLFFPRYPALTPDGSSLLFTAGGDIWTVPASGGTARRVTDHVGEEIAPIVSRDGQWLAYASNQFGNFDVFALPMAGGEPRRLTHHSADDVPSDFTSEGAAVIFNSGRVYHAGIYAVDRETSQTHEVLDDYWLYEYNARISPDGRQIVFNDGWGYGRWWRPWITSSRSAQIIVADVATVGDDGVSFIAQSPREIITEPHRNMWPQWSADGRILFAGLHEGTPNLLSIAADGTSRRALTNFTSDAVRRPSVSADGKWVVFEYNFGIWRMPTDGSNDAVAIPIELTLGHKEQSVAVETLTGDIDEYALSPDGSRVCFAVRGELFLAAAEDPKEIIRLTNTPWRESGIAWHPDGSQIAFISDRSGEGDLYRMDLLSANTTKLSKSEQLPEALPIVSDDGKSVVCYEGHNSIVRYSWDGSTREVIVDGEFEDAPLGEVAGFDLSPDGIWLAYQMLGSTFDTDVWLKKIGDTINVNVSRTRDWNYMPRFSDDGKTLTYVSSMLGDSRIMRVELTDEARDFERDRLDSLARNAREQFVVRDKEGDDKKKDDRKHSKHTIVAIDLLGLHDRIRPVNTLSMEQSWPVLSPDGKTYVYVAAPTGESQLWAEPSDPDDREEPTRLTSHGGAKSQLQFEPESNTVFYLSGGRIRSVWIDGKDGKTIDTKATVQINHADRRKQMFGEMRRILKNYFYDPNLHGLNIDSIAAAYEPMIAATRTDLEFRDLVMRLIGALDASHLNYYGMDPQTPAALQSGYLGVEWDRRRLAQGEYVVSRVLAQSPAGRSPSRLNVGDRIVSVDGIEFGADHDFDELMAGTIGRRVILDVTDTRGQRRTVKIEPIPEGTRRTIWWQDWERRNRAFVDSMSGGRLGYVYIRAMNAPALEKFKREIVSETIDRDAVILDVRHNPGGSIAVHLLEVLMKRPYVMRTFRSGPPESENVVRSTAWEKPLALLIDAGSASNSEILAEGFRRLELGPIIGMPTAGAVIGTGAYKLIDGTTFRRPSWGAYTADMENLEGPGREPDIRVPLTHDDALTGRDPQLQRAITELLEAVSD